MTSYDKLNDLELVALFKEGNEQAYTEIFYRYNRLLYVHAFKMLGDKEEAKDVVQEIFAVLWANRQQLTLKSNLSGFLYTSIRNRIFDWFSRQEVASRYVISIQQFIDEGEAVTDHLVRSNELTQIIEKEIDRLPAKMKEIFELSRKQNLSNKEIAAHLNLSEKTVKNQVNNALKILRVKLGLFIYLFLICM